MVKPEGNHKAQELLRKIFTISDREWRGIGTIPVSGLEVRPEYASFDANLKFNINIKKVEEPKECIAGLVLKGIKKPMECSQFGKKCTPQNPMGAPNWLVQKEHVLHIITSAEQQKLLSNLTHFK